MHDPIPLGMALILGLGMAAQWISWRLNLPSILLLLLTGIAVGPVLGWVDPEHIFGDLMHPIISLAVAVILFEGGLSLRLSDLREVGRTVRNLITIGVVVTWALASVSAWGILGMPLRVAVLLGAILVVTGPTVIIPMLRHIRPKGRIGPVVKWEGIINDPIGAILAVLVFEAIQAPAFGDVTQQTLLILGRTLGFGVGIGALGAVFLAQALSRRMIPDYLSNAITLAVVIAVNAMANEVQSESGLFAVTAMGIMLANQNRVSVHGIAEFKEDLQVILISTLFIMLSASLDLDAFREVGRNGLLFLVVLIVVVRPLSIIASTITTNMTWSERIFLIWMAPRGIVAAAVSSLFALRLTAIEVEGAEQLVPVTFVVIAGTVAFYGLTAPFIASRTGLTATDAQGMLFLGAQRWVREVALVLRDAGVDVRLVDRNPHNIAVCRSLGLDATEGNVLIDGGENVVDLAGMSRAAAVTSNDEVNTLAAVQFERVFGTDAVFRLAPADPHDQRVDPAQILFDRQVTFDLLERRTAGGAEFMAETLDSDDGWEDLLERLGDDAVVLFVVTAGGKLQTATASNELRAGEGDTVIVLADAPAATPAPAASTSAP